MEISKNRYNGYHDALVKHGSTENPDRVRICDNRAQAEVLTPEILREENHPDAFFAINDDTAIGILYTAKRMGFDVPNDIVELRLYQWRQSQGLRSDAHYGRTAWSGSRRRGCQYSHRTGGNVRTPTHDVEKRVGNNCLVKELPDKIEILK